MKNINININNSVQNFNFCLQRKEHDPNSNFRLIIVFIVDEKKREKY